MSWWQREDVHTQDTKPFREVLLAKARLPGQAATLAMVPDPRAAAPPPMTRHDDQEAQEKMDPLTALLLVAWESDQES